MKTSPAHALMVVFFSAVTSSACSNGGKVDIGDTQAVGARLSDYAASWDGYAEAYTFSPDGTDRVRLTLDPNGQGTLRPGDSALLPPPTDPNVGYPPGISDGHAINGDLWTGFQYQVYGAQITENRIQIGINPKDLFAAWCAIETPVPSENTTLVSVDDAGIEAVTTTSYACLPDTGGSKTGSSCYTPDANGQDTQPVDCDKLFLCAVTPVCTCTATSCAIPSVPTDTPPSGYPVELDAALDSSGSSLTGTLLLDGQRITVRMQKQ